MAFARQHKTNVTRRHSRRVILVVLQTKHMTVRPKIDSCDLRIVVDGVSINGTPLDVAGSVAAFHTLLGEPTRIVPAGPPADR